MASSSPPAAASSTSSSTSSPASTSGGAKPAGGGLNAKGKPRTINDPITNLRAHVRFLYEPVQGSQFNGFDAEFNVRPRAHTHYDNIQYISYYFIIEVRGRSPLSIM